MPDTSAWTPGECFAGARGFVRSRLVFGIVALAVAGAAIWFLGDVPNRYRASQAMREGRVALLASDLSKALRFFRVAALARPTDEAIVQQYDQTQTRWVEMVSGQLADENAAKAYLTLQRLLPTEPMLVEPHLGHFRAKAAAVTAAARAYAEQQLANANEDVGKQHFEEACATLKAIEPLQALVPALPARLQAAREAQLAAALAAAEEAMNHGDFAGARATRQSVAALGAGREDYQKLGPAIDAAEVRAALQAASAATEKSDYAEATRQLAHAAELKALPEEVAKAQAGLHERARAYFAFLLARGLAANRPDDVAAALADGKVYAGWDTVDPRRLEEPASLTDFLSALDTCGLGPKAMARYVDRADIPLVIYCRAKFPADVVKAFLRDGYEQWSRLAARENFPGLALYLDEQAQTQGAPASAAWRETVLAQAIESTHVAVAVADPKPDANAPAGLNEAATAALRKALKERLTSWPSYVELDPAHPPTVVLRGIFSGFDAVDDDSDMIRKTVRYQSGTRQVRNPEEESLHDEYEDLLERRNNLVDGINQKQAFVDQVNSNPSADAFTRSQAVDRAIEIAGDRMLVSQWDRKLDDLRRRGRSLPRYLNEPVYSDETYRIIHHVYTCSLGWSVIAELHGAMQHVSAVEAETTFKTDEVAGNASHGVPVRSPQPVPREKLTKELVPRVIAKAANVDEVLAELPALTLQSFAAFHQETAPIKRADQFVALAYAWSAKNRILPRDAKKEIFAYAAQVLNLQ